MIFKFIMHNTVTFYFNVYHIKSKVAKLYQKLCNNKAHTRKKKKCSSKNSWNWFDIFRWIYRPTKKIKKDWRIQIA